MTRRSILTIGTIGLCLLVFLLVKPATHETSNKQDKVVTRLKNKNDALKQENEQLSLKLADRDIDTIDSNESTVESTSISRTMSDKESSLPVKDELDHVVYTFVSNYINFDTIDSRNQSVKPVLTDSMIEEKSINVMTHADFDSTGEVATIYRDLYDSNLFVVFGSDTTRGETHQFVARIETENEKISQYMFEYVANH